MHVFLRPVVLTFVINVLVRLTAEVTATNEGDTKDLHDGSMNSLLIPRKIPKIKPLEINKDIISSRRGLQFQSPGSPFLTLDIDSYGEVHPSRMDIGPDGLMYFTGGTDFRAYVTSSFADDPVVFAEIKNGAGLTIGCQFDAFGNFYMVNGAGVYQVPYDKVINFDLPRPHKAELFFKWTTDPLIPSGIGIDKNNHQIYVSDMGKGEIWKIDINTGVGSIWASSSQIGYQLLYGELGSTNFMGVPFGVDEVMVDAESKWLYFTSYEHNFFGRILIQTDGSAGVLQVLDIVEGRSALSGAFLDTRNNKLYGTTPFTNFQNGVMRDPKAKKGGEVWMLDLDDIDDSGTGGKAKMILQDLNFGTPTDVITGYGFWNENELYVLDGSYDTLKYPSGVVPNPNASYHAAIRVLWGPNCKKNKTKRKCKKAPGCIWWKDNESKEERCMWNDYDYFKCREFSKKSVCNGSGYCMRKGKKCKKPKCDKLNEKKCSKLYRLCLWEGDKCVILE